MSGLTYEQRIFNRCCTLGDRTRFDAAAIAKEADVEIAGLTASLASAQQALGELKEYEFLLFESGAEWAAASGSSSDLAGVLREAAHYQMMYGQDGPCRVEVYAIHRVRLDARGIVSPEGVETVSGSTAQPQEPDRREPTRPSKGFLKGESPQATWPFAQDDKGSE